MKEKSLERKIKKLEEENMGLKRKLEEDRLAMLNIIEDLRESEERYKKLFEQSPIAITVIEEDGTVSMANENFAKLTGYSLDEMIGQHFTKFVAEEDRERMMKYHEERITGKGKPPTRYEYKCLRKDGEMRDVELSIIKLPGNRTLSCKIDITERKKMEEELRKSEEKYRLVTENSQDIIYAINKNYELLFVTGDIEGITGYTLKDLPDGDLKKAIFAVPPEDIKVIGELSERVWKGEKNVKGEFRIIRKDGKVRWVEVSLSPLYDEKGKVYGNQGILRDITERKKLEEELRKSEEKYRTLAESAEEIIVIHDTEGRIIYVNEYGVRRSGYSKKEILGRRVEEFVPEEYHKEIEERRKKRRDGERSVVKFEMEFVAKNGKRVPVEVIASPLIWEKEVHILLIARDITEKIKLIKQLKESEEKYRTLVENAVEGIYRTTIDGKILEVNPAVAKMFGYSQEEFSRIKNVGSTYRNPEKRKEFIEKLKKEGEVKNYKIEYIRKNGKILIATESARLTKDGIIEGTIHDVTEEREYEKKIEAIAKVSNSLVGKINLDEIYEKSLRQIVKALGADGGVIFEVKKKYLYLKKTYGISKEYRRKYRKIPIGYHLVGKVAKSGKPILIKESEKDKRATPSVIESEEYHSAIVVPIIFEGKIIGSMGIISKKSNYFSHKDIEVLRSIANQVATAINAAKMHHKMIKTLEREREFKLRAAHYFFNPIAIAKGFLDLAIEEVPEKQKKRLKAVNHAIGRVEKVVKNVTQRGEIYE
ncbi:MAG: PAS domain S-box protein [Thermoplasmata archaeon]|nr:MAG: PAS domain S-box protein [Thermoplasmata archaeon]